VVEKDGMLHIIGDLVSTLPVTKPRSLRCEEFERLLPEKVINKLETQLVDLQVYLVDKLSKGLITRDEIIPTAELKHPYFRNRESVDVSFMAAAVILTARAILWFVTLTMFKFNPSIKQNYMKVGLYDLGEREHFEASIPATEFNLIQRHPHVSDIVKNITN
jgi:hypothetical protein